MRSAPCFGSVKNLMAALSVGGRRSWFFLEVIGYASGMGFRCHSFSLFCRRLAGHGLFWRVFGANRLFIGARRRFVVTAAHFCGWVSRSFCRIPGDRPFIIAD